MSQVEPSVIQIIWVTDNLLFPIISTLGEKAYGTPVSVTDLVTRMAARASWKN